MDTNLDQRSLLRIGIGLSAAATILLDGLAASEPLRDVTYVEDFDELWRTLAERYCFFGEKRTDWNAVRALYRPLALGATNGDDFAAVIDWVLNELYDARTHRSDGTDGTARLPYYDMWVEAGAGGGARVTSVRDGSAAADAGIVAGDVVTSVDGLQVARRAAASMPQCLRRPDPAAAAYALNVAVSGRRGQPRRLTIARSDGRERSLTLPLKIPPKLPDVDSRVLPGGYGYIVIRSFADQAVIEAFDAALLRFRDAPGLVIDVRQNGGGDTAVARPIMGRFIDERKPYALMRRRDGERLGEAWTEFVDPRGPFTYRAPVAVLTTTWSASMAEGFPMGMRGIGRATVFGTPMMRVGAAVFPLRLDRTGIDLQYSAEPVYDVHGGPRWTIEPDVLVEGSGDILEKAIAVLAAERNGGRGRTGT